MPVTIRYRATLPGLRQRLESAEAAVMARKDTVPLYVQAMPGLSGRQEQSSSSAGEGEAPEVPFLFFNSISNTTACSGTNISWDYAGPSTPMSLTVVSINKTSTSPEAGRRLSQTLSYSVDPVDKSYTWLAVALPEGWYRLHANFPVSKLSVSSNDFFVVSGDDKSCFQSVASFTSINSLSPSTISPSPQPGESDAPTDMTKIVMIGGSVGGTILLVTLALLSWFCVRHRRRQRRQLQDAGKSLKSYGSEVHLIGKEGPDVTPLPSPFRMKEQGHDAEDVLEIRCAGSLSPLPTSSRDTQLPHSVAAPCQVLAIDVASLPPPSPIIFPYVSRMNYSRPTSLFHSPTDSHGGDTPPVSPSTIIPAYPSGVSGNLGGDEIGTLEGGYNLQDPGIRATDVESSESARGDLRRGS